MSQTKVEPIATSYPVFLGAVLIVLMAICTVVLLAGSHNYGISYEDLRKGIALLGFMGAVAVALFALGLYRRR